MPTETVDVGVTDRELFDEANMDEAPAEEAVAEVPAAEPEPTEPTEQPEQSGQPRDEHGRFAATTATEPGQAAAQPPPVVDDNAAMVPSWRVREINEEKRALAEKVAAFEAERLQWQRQQVQQPPQQVQPATPPARPDPLLDPDGYAAAIRQELREEALNERRETSLANAHKTYKTEFEEAYAAAQKQVDPALKARMQQSRDPGETLMEWHRERKTMAEVGNDPNAFFNKRLDAWLADPANQAKALERIRGGAQQQLQPGAPKPAPAVSLPPSLTRTASAATIDADDDDISNDGLWRHANA